MSYLRISGMGWETSDGRVSTVIDSSYEKGWKLYADIFMTVPLSGSYMYAFDDAEKDDEMSPKGC